MSTVIKKKIISEISEDVNFPFSKSKWLKVFNKNDFSEKTEYFGSFLSYPDFRSSDLFLSTSLIYFINVNEIKVRKSIIKHLTSFLKTYNDSIYTSLFKKMLSVMEKEIDKDYIHKVDTTYRLRYYKGYYNEIEIRCTKPRISLTVRIDSKKKENYSPKKALLTARGVLDMVDDLGATQAYIIFSTIVHRAINYLLDEIDSEVELAKKIYEDSKVNPTKSHATDLKNMGFRHWAKEVSSAYKEFRRKDNKARLKLVQEGHDPGSEVDGVIYRIYKTSNNKTYYIGKTDNGFQGYKSRISSHFNPKTKSKIAKVINALGESEFSYEIIVHKKASSRELAEIEEGLIKKYGTYSKCDNYNGYGCNMSIGGEGGKKSLLKKWENVDTYLTLLKENTPRSEIEFAINHQSLYRKAKNNFCLKNLVDIMKLTNQDLKNNLTSENFILFTPHNEEPEHFLEIGKKIYFFGKDIGVVMKIDTFKNTKYTPREFFYFNIRKGSMKTFLDTQEKYFEAIDLIHEMFFEDFKDFFKEKMSKYNIKVNNLDKTFGNAWRIWRSDLKY